MYADDGITQLRPEGWQCPWCSRDELGQEVADPEWPPVDFTLPLELRVCYWCAHPTYGPPVITPHERSVWERINSHRATLRSWLREDWAAGGDGDLHLSPAGRKRWHWFQFGAGMIAHGLLGSLESMGLDRREELQAAIEDVFPSRKETHAKHHRIQL
jgi:hypothetical protein